MTTVKDPAQVFLIYMALVGDEEKTALALDLNVETVHRMAVQDGWADKVRRISVLSKSSTPGDYERAQNRALNFVQCHQLRKQIDRLIFELQSAEDIRTKFIKMVDRGGVEMPELTARFLSDLTAAMDRVHAMTYAALGDTPKERTERGPGNGDPVREQGIHSALIGALNSTKTQAPADTLIAGVNATVEQLKCANLS